MMMRLSGAAMKFPDLALVLDAVEHHEQPPPVEERTVQANSLTGIVRDPVGGDAERLQETARDSGGVLASVRGRVEVRVELPVGQVHGQFVGQPQGEGRLAHTHLTADHQGRRGALSAVRGGRQGPGALEQLTPSHQGVSLHRQL